MTGKNADKYDGDTQRTVWLFYGLNRHYDCKLQLNANTRSSATASQSDQSGIDIHLAGIFPQYLSYVVDEHYIYAQGCAWDRISCLV